MQNYARTHLRILFMIVFVLVPFWGLRAQQANTMYYMSGVPQRYQLNPAFQPECNFFLGLPGFSPLQVQFRNSAFAPGDVLEYNEELDSWITFLHPAAIKNNKQKFLDMLPDQNFIGGEFSMDIASFGFSSVEYGTYVTFDIRQRMETRFSFPDDLFMLPIYGPDSAMTFDFNGMGLDASVFSEFSMGISQKFGDKLSIGWRGKLLFGQANLRTEKFDLRLSSGEEAWPVHSALEFNAAVPFMNIVYDENGLVDLENSDIKTEEELRNEMMELIFNPRNFGMAMDMGVDYMATEWLELSASVVDFGSIRWRDGVHNLKSQADYGFQGIEVDIDDDDFMNTFLDSLDQTFNNFESTESEYRTWLATKVYAGADFHLRKGISLGLLSRTAFYGNDTRQQFSFSANFRPLRMLSASFSYSILDNSYKNLGMGIALRARPFNLYIVSDTGPSAVFWPFETKNLNLRMGMNLVFGCQKKKPVYDRPLVD